MAIYFRECTQIRLEPAFPWLSRRLHLLGDDVATPPTNRFGRNAIDGYQYQLISVPLDLRATTIATEATVRHNIQTTTNATLRDHPQRSLPRALGLFTNKRIEYMPKPPQNKAALLSHNHATPSLSRPYGLDMGAKKSDGLS
jgi:hypothetical protein